MDFVTGIVSNALSGFVDSATRTAGGYAGDFVIRAGDMIESSGRGVGDSVSAKGGAWGTAISAYGVTPPAARAAVSKSKAITGSAASAKPAAIKRSNSTPAKAFGGPASAATKKVQPKPISGASKPAVNKTGPSSAISSGLATKKPPIKRSNSTPPNKAAGVSGAQKRLPAPAAVSGYGGPKKTTPVQARANSEANRRPAQKKMPAANSNATSRIQNKATGPVKKKAPPTTAAKKV